MLPCLLLLIVAVATLGRVFTASIGFRRLGGKLAHLDHLGAGKSRQHFLHPWIGFGGALALIFLQIVLRTQRRLSSIVGHDHGPAPSGPLFQFSREIVDQRPRGAALQRALEPSVFDADQADIGFERGLGQQIAFLAGERHQFGKACNPKSEEHTSELQSLYHLVCRLLLEKKKKKKTQKKIMYVYTSKTSTDIHTR